VVRPTATCGDNRLTLPCEENNRRTIHLSDVSERTLRLFHLWLYGQCSREIPDLDLDEIEYEISTKRHKGAGNNEQLLPAHERLFLEVGLLNEDDQEETKEELEEGLEEELEEELSLLDDSSDSEAGSTESRVDPQELENEVSGLAEETREMKKGQQWLEVSEGKSTKSEP
jgi:hypothetical protein